ncbi:unnamed protein product [Thlaspi arvense]|uniref:NAC domain-containing protein n=1 Tax=Thlaspi arvense TaxID=13288 RepID=A0AAU9SSB8_THLAR|nr:unnamed protein product [Thlaspi arvense]
METKIVGYRFYPTGEELINHYLKNKIMGRTWLVDDVIGEINISSYEPESLPPLSKIKSKDHTWFFFSRKEYTSAKKKTFKRTTRYGYWKATGKDRTIFKENDRRNGIEIGIKKTFVYHQGKVSSGIRTPWVMHEYHITCLPLHQRTYVICKIIYKGDVGDIPSGSNSSHSLVFDDSNTVGAISTQPELVLEQPGEESSTGLSVNDLTMLMNEQEDLCTWDVLDLEPNTFFTDNNNYNNPNVQPQTPYDDEYWSRLFGGL